MTELAPSPSVVVPLPSFRVAELRVKVRSLADEARIIRHEEERAKAKARGSRDDSHRAWHQRTVESLHLHRTVKSLHLHRTGVVRSAARTAQLAVAFLRQIPYRAVEATVRPGNRPDVEAIQRTVERFGGAGIVAAWVALP